MYTERQDQAAFSEKKKLPPLAGAPARRLQTAWAGLKCSVQENGSSISPTSSHTEHRCRYNCNAGAAISMMRHIATPAKAGGGLMPLAVTRCRPGGATPAALPARISALPLLSATRGQLRRGRVPASAVKNPHQPESADAAVVRLPAYSATGTPVAVARKGPCSPRFAVPVGSWLLDGERCFPRLGSATTGAGAPLRACLRPAGARIHPYLAASPADTRGFLFAGVFR